MGSLIPRNSFVSAAMGTMVEYYDYALLSLFFPIMAPLFFPSHSTYDSLARGFNLLFIAMAARPLGGALFGYFGDRFGRRKALIGSMYGIAVATILIGITPSYAVIGIWATIILVAAKAVQIFCFGGEYNGAGIYVIEHAKNQNESLVGSMLCAITLLGSLLASLIGIVLTFSWMPNWSWRIAFFIGGIVGIIGIFYRKNLVESPHFEQADRHKDNFKTLCKHYPLELLAGMFIGGFTTVPFTSVLVFIVPVLMTKGFITTQQFMIVQSVLITFAMLVTVIAGRIADQKTPLRIMQMGALALCLFAYPALWSLDSGTKIGCFIGAVLLILINEIVVGPSHAFLKNLFPMKYRYRGSSFSFTTGMSLLGGFTPVIEAYLYRKTGHFSAIAIWLIFLGVGTWVTLTLAWRKRIAVGDKVFIIRPPII